MNAIATLILPETVPVWYLFASILATLFGGSLLVGLAALLTWWGGRGKPAAEINESTARAAKDLAEADEIRIRASLSLGEEAMHWTYQMIQAQRIIFQQQQRIEDLEKENTRLLMSTSQRKSAS